MTEPREDIVHESKSREQFEKDLHQECRLIEARVAAAKRYTDGIQIILTFAKDILEQAERDTRERIARLLEAEMIKVAQSENVLPAPTHIRNAEHFACIGAVGALKRMAERIRGKENEKGSEPAGETKA